MTMSKVALSGLDPLKDLLGDVLSRLEALEAKVGIKAGSSMPKQPAKSTVTAPLLNGKSRKDIFFANFASDFGHRFLQPPPGHVD